jgi:hypothetical protein
VYERKHDRLLSRHRFAHRVLMHGVAAFSLLVVSLAIGMAGYESFEDLAWRDAFLNAAMLLGGMGPVNPPQTDAGKVFAGCYALYAGLVFLLIVGLVFTPVVHRLLHRFHWDEDDR